MTTIREGDLLWTPSQARRERSHVLRYMQWLEEHRGLHLENYEALWRWSITDLESFWGSVWDFFGVQARRPLPGAWASEHAGSGVVSGRAAQLCRPYSRARASRGDRLLSMREGEPLQRMSWATLGDQVRILATELRRMGVRPGDRVAAVLPNAPQAAIATLATASIGAIWSCCGPDFGTKGVLERFSQLAPKVLIYVDCYQYGGKHYDRTPNCATSLKGLDSMSTRFVCPIVRRTGSLQPPTRCGLGTRSWISRALRRPILSASRCRSTIRSGFCFPPERRDCPKPIVHGHGGILLEHLKHLHFNYEATRDEPLFFFTTTVVDGLEFLAELARCGCRSPCSMTAIPSYPKPDALWKVIEESGATLFGTSPAYIDFQRKAGVVPGQSIRS